VRSIERQRTFPGIAQETDVSDIAELAGANRRVRRIVGRIVIEGRDARIRLAVVVAEEAFEIAGQPRPAIGRGQRPVAGKPLVGRELDRVEVVDWRLKRNRDAWDVL